MGSITVGFDKVIEVSKGCPTRKGCTDKDPTEVVVEYKVGYAYVHVRPSRDLRVNDAVLAVPTAEKRVPFHVTDVSMLPDIPVGSVGVVQLIPSTDVVSIPFEPFTLVHCPTATHKYPFQVIDFAIPEIFERPLVRDHVTPSLEVNKDAIDDPLGFIQFPPRTNTIPFHRIEFPTDPSINSEFN